MRDTAPSGIDRGTVHGIQYPYMGAMVTVSIQKLPDNRPYHKWILKSVEDIHVYPKLIERMI